MRSEWADAQHPRVRWDAYLDRPDFEGIEETGGELELSGVTIKSLLLDLTAFSLVSFEDCLIESCRILTSPSTDVRITRCAFRWCDFSGVFIGKGCARSRFRDCKLIGTDFAGSTIRDVEITESIVTDASLRSTDVQRFAISKSRITNLDASSAKLEHVTFPGSACIGLNFDQATCTSVDLTDVAELELKTTSGLAGCRVTVTQTVELAAALAADAGLHVATD